MVYLESIRCDEVRVVRGRPAICFWTIDDMLRRQDFEINSGGFGIRDFQVAFVPNAAQQENIQASKDESAEVC